MKDMFWKIKTERRDLKYNTGHKWIRSIVPESFACAHIHISQLCSVVVRLLDVRTILIYFARLSNQQYPLQPYHFLFTRHEIENGLRASFLPSTKLGGGTSIK